MDNLDMIILTTFTRWDTQSHITHCQFYNNYVVQKLFIFKSMVLKFKIINIYRNNVLPLFVTFTERKKILSVWFKMYKVKFHTLYKANFKYFLMNKII